MSSNGSGSPRLTTMLTAIDELTDVLIATQHLSDRFYANKRPYLRFRARELEHVCHEQLDVMELLSTGWEPGP